MTTWRWWRELWDHHEPPYSLALVRILVGLVLCYDYLRVLQLGIVDVLWAPEQADGIPDVLFRNPVPELYQWFPLTTTPAWIAWGLCLAGAVGVTLGLYTRLSALVFVVVSAQLAQVLPLGDRGIDMLLRNVMAILAFSEAGAAWSVEARWRGGPRAEIPAWPRHLLILQLGVVYFLAGVQKTALSWTPFGGFTALYLVLQDPAIARADFAWLEGVLPLTQLATLSTLLFEWSAGFLPLVYWYRATRTRPGRLRAWFNRVRPLRLWLPLGVALHLGIALTMALGIFPFAMLALYPSFFHPDEWRWGWRRQRATGVQAAGPSSL